MRSARRLLGLGGLVIVLALLASSGGGAATTYDLLLSTSSNRANAVPLAGATASGNVYVFTSPDTTDITRVRFWLDNPQHTGTPLHSEAGAPYDLVGTNTDVNRTAKPFDTSSLTDGPHTITASVDLASGSSFVVSSTFTVQNGASAPPPPPAGADQIHLAWVDDPATTMTVVWRTLDATVPSNVEYRAAGAQDWLTASGGLRASGTEGSLHQATLRSLTPATAYEYRVQDEATSWSQVFTTRTSPDKDGTFDFVYVADTGLIGRLDGLAAGTEQVRDEIVKLHPNLVLGGGDYAYFDTDKRYVTIERSIDAWFNQMQPIASSAPLMPTYGNHEVLLEGKNFTKWAARFPTPSGHAGPDGAREDYSFDVGYAHFVSITAVYDRAGLDQGTLDWIDADLKAARASGQRWLIAYMHVPPFADGGNHGQNLVLRGQLAPIFERYGVDLSISSHDQAYERSYPLTNVDGTLSGYTRTSTSKTCYGTADGTIWVKVSPGGKLSNISNAFAPFKHATAPSWTAVRNNTMHTFADVSVSPTEIEFTDYGVVGDGSSPVVTDRFRFTTGSCGGTTTPKLTFSPSSASLSAVAGGTPTSTTTQLATSDGGSPAVTLSDSATWLSVAPTSSAGGGTVALTADPAGLQAGTYNATVTAAASGYTTASLPVTFTVGSGGGGGAYTLLSSTSASRATPVSLAGRTVSGAIYVFTSPDTADISRVRFWLDNPAMTGTPRHSESSAPYDLVGGTTTTASPFDTKTLANGQHTISASIDATNGTSTRVSATFTVSN